MINMSDENFISEDAIVETVLKSLYFKYLYTSLDSDSFYDDFKKDLETVIPVLIPGFNLEVFLEVTNISIKVDLNFWKSSNPEDIICISKELVWNQ